LQEADHSIQQSLLNRGVAKLSMKQFAYSSATLRESEEVLEKVNSNLVHNEKWEAHFHIASELAGRLSRGRE
jgi:hypothetical protein